MKYLWFQAAHIIHFRRYNKFHWWQSSGTHVIYTTASAIYKWVSVCLCVNKESCRSLAHTHIHTHSFFPSFTHSLDYCLCFCFCFGSKYLMEISGKRKWEKLQTTPMMKRWHRIQIQIKQIESWTWCVVRIACSECVNVSGNNDYIRRLANLIWNHLLDVSPHNHRHTCTNESPPLPPKVSVSHWFIRTPVVYWATEFHILEIYTKH